MSLAPGTKLGAYEIVALLGSGGMGEVWRARDSRLGRDVAIKVLPAGVAGDPDRLARFEREARAVAALNHPNIVTLHSVEEAAGVRFLTMELVEGESLDRLLETGGLPIARVLALAIPMADALAAAHARGVVHRDLKPANVMVTPERRVKVLDFGLAKTADPGPDLGATRAATVASPVSAVGLIVGTVPYMSPEQLRGDVLDARTDLFSLGVLLYELATGRRPFGGASSAEVSSAILRDTPAPVRALRGDLPQDLERIVARCLEKDPERRIQTAKDVRNELELIRRALDSAPSHAAAAPAPVPDVRALPSIAVLPFENRSRDEEDEYFADGLADELLNVIGRIRGLRVAARTSSRQFKGGADDPATIGRKLNVATLIEGSVRKSGSRVRITVQLVSVADGFHLWSESYDRTLDDIFAVQDDIAQSVVSELRRRLLGEEPDSRASGEVRAEVAAALAGRGSDAEAHQLFFRARHFLGRRGPGDSTRAIALLRQAVGLEPGHARAWATLARAEMARGDWGETDVEPAYARARAALARAIELQPDLADAHLAIARIHAFHEFDIAAGLVATGRALEAAPRDAEALTEHAAMQMLCSRFEEAVATLSVARELDPLSASGSAGLARAYLSMGRLESAIAAFREALEISPEMTPLRGLMGLVISELGRHDEALAEIAREAAPWAREFAAAVVLHRAGRPRESREALARLLEEGGGSAHYQIAYVHSELGEIDRAFEHLERAHASHDSGFAFLRSQTRLWRPLVGDPRWAALLARLRFPD
ncbi:MAG TPA: protein kinase [Candidatus Acidoferrales bacterium]|nr:protein kinase [Candidatus Acidoferrales bacterium]